MKQNKPIHSLETLFENVGSGGEGQIQDKIASKPATDTSSGGEGQIQDKSASNSSKPATGRKFEYSESSQVDEALMNPTMNPIHDIQTTRENQGGNSAPSSSGHSIEVMDSEFKTSSFSLSDISMEEESELKSSAEPEKIGTFRRLSKLGLGLISTSMKVASLTVASGGSALPNTSGTVLSGGGDSSDDNKSRTSTSAFLCQICQNKYDANREGFSYSNCIMEHVFCRPCITAYTNTQIESDCKKQPCPCLNDGCDGFANSEEIKQLATRTNFERFSKLEFQEVLDGHETSLSPNSSPIWSPKKNKKKSNFNRNVFVQCPSCFVVMSGGRAGNPKFPVTTCLVNGCGLQFCFFHGLSHSVQLTCLEYAQEISAAALLESNGQLRGHLSCSPSSKHNELERKDVKYCPDCNTRTRKLDAYNSMYCSYCRGCWCWLCNMPADGDHFMPWNIINGCPGQETVDWETPLDTTGEEGHKRLKRKRKLYGLSVFVLFLLYVALRYSMVVIPVAIIVTASGLIALVIAPIMFVYAYWKASETGADFPLEGNALDVLRQAKTCSIPFASSTRLPFSRIDDYIFVTTIYVAVGILCIWFFVLFVLWIPVGALILALSQVDAKEEVIFAVFHYLIGSSTSTGQSDVVEFFIWPLGLPAYIIRSVFES